MTAPSPVWAVQDIVYGKHDIVFRIEISPENFVNSQTSFSKYARYINDMFDRDCKTTYDEFYDWVVAPFLPILAEVQASPLDGRAFTLRDYLEPETYYLQLYFVDERMEPRFDYDVQMPLREPGVYIGDVALHPGWSEYTPETVQQCLSDGQYGYSKHPRKVCVDGKLCFFKKPRSKRELLRLSNNSQVRVPRLIGVVYAGQHCRHAIGILLSLVDCDNRTLSCALHGEVAIAQRRKWEEQITTTVELLHEADIIWGDVKPNNVLIDRNEDAWVIDFGGGYTPGWVEKEHMETIKGDRDGLSKIKDRIYSHDGSEEGGRASQGDGTY
ncbi:uncharacterized protein BO88DRAFT_427151 [Aspergillus vadensis CBS 113365]|uniref:Protein kinase domain-containing protein n=1 Tax=Aspergillus vadensis (strain CBS 113365 / IMI 142717 / IBT 24658) TaxID=1448311 RepID=A0A319B4R4_ASPVC|nr:hypothetical protein BO88DRAFT_427151 [Aspergillus vadensis CBS 113365]PYH67415.1 hypothetical protein BO88DRAFT_427151 [Aspergillus vadensis CBS 113365]